MTKVKDGFYSDYNSSNNGLYLKIASATYGRFFINTSGTTSTGGISVLEIGNAVATGSDNNASGQIHLYSASTKPHIIVGSSTTTQYTHTFPNSTGWIATGGNGSSTGVGGAKQFTYLNSSGVITASTQTLGSSSKPIYLSSGTFTECSELALSSHTHTFASITDKIVSSNEFNFADVNDITHLWINYQLSDGSASQTDGITQYTFGRGLKKSAANGNCAYLYANGYRSSVNNSDNYILLAGGGTKPVSDFSTTDDKVKQSSSSTTNWRGVVLGYNNNSSANTGITTEVTNQVYVTNNITVQSSTGALSSKGRGTFYGLTSVSGDIIFNSTNHIVWNSGSYHQRIFITDDSTANTQVFNFQQSIDTGSTWNNLLTIYDNGNLRVHGNNEYIGSGTGVQCHLQYDNTDSSFNFIFD